jgi:hypothetical protein
MPQNHAAIDQSSSFSATLLHRVRSLITFRRIGFSLAGTLAFAGAATALNTSAVNSSGSVDSSQPKHTVSTERPSAPVTDAATGNTDSSSSSASSSTSFSSNTTNGQTTVHMNVNGQDIPVSPNSQTHQTITNADGSQTTVNSSSTVSNQGSVSNSSTTNFSLHVSTNSSSTGGSSGE